MKTKRIAKFLGLGLAVALAFSLGAGIGITPVSAGVQEWDTITTPSWEDEVITPGSDIYDYAVGPDGETIVAVGAVDNSGPFMVPATKNGLRGSFNISGGSITFTKISDALFEVEGYFTGDSCYLFGDFTICSDFEGNVDEFFNGYITGEITGDPFDEQDNDLMEFSGKIYGDNSGVAFELSPLDIHDDSDDICINEGEIGDDTVINIDLGAPFPFLTIDPSDGWDGAQDGVYAQPRVWKSTDGGVTWTNIIDDVQDADNLPGPFISFQLGGVDIAPDDEDWFVIAGNICNAAGWYEGDMPWMPITGGYPAAVATQSGGSFSYTDNMEDSANDTWMLQVYDVAVSPEVDGIHNIAIAGINDDQDGSVFRLEAGTWLAGSWEDTSFYDGWDDSVNTGLPDVDTAGVVAVDFSDNFDLDDTVVCMGADGIEPGLPYIQQGTWGSDNAWNNEAAFSDAILIDNDGETLLTGVYIRSMGFALPADYDGTDSGARAIYCYVNAYNTVTELTGGFLFRVDDGSVSEAYGPSGEPLLASIDFHGDADTGKMMVGEYVEWDMDDTWFEGDAGSPVQPDPCEGVNVWHTVELDPCCPDWELACKNPSGPFMAQVMYTPDGDKAYATTNGLLDLEYFDLDIFAGYLDESAFSVSLDDGVSFNQIGLIDTDIDCISDIAVCPDCSVIYISTINEVMDMACSCFMSVEQWGECDSVWRSYDNGDTWERIFHGDWSSTCECDEELLLRLPCEDTEDCCTLYLGIQGTDELYYSRDCGQCWTQTPGTKIDIQDFAVAAENEVMVIDKDGYFSMSTQFGRRWSDEVDTEISSGEGHSITSCCIDDLIVVGGYKGDVAFSEDKGETWSLTDELPSAADHWVHLACDPNCPGTIYAAVSGYGIYRTTTDSGEWDDLNAAALEYYGIVVARTGGAIYAPYYGDPSDDDNGYNNIVDCEEGWVDHNTGVARNLDPCDTACCGSEDWDYLEAGLGVDTEEFAREPSALRICGCLSMDTPSVLYAIDVDGDYDVVDGSDGQVWTYEDCTAKQAPELLSPMCGEDIAADDCWDCDNADITLCWTNICGACEYDIEIATDEDFTQTVYQYYWYDGEDLECFEPADCADPCYLIPAGSLQAGTTYYWHVRVHEVDTGDIAHSQWSETCSFNIMSGVGVSLLAPENGSMGIGIEGVGFSWTGVGGATSYSFVLSENSDLSGAMASEELSGTAYTYTGMLDYSTPYFWQVTAWKNGSELATSDVGAFTTAGEPEPAPEPPPPAEPAPDIVIPPAEQITPNWIIAVIAIGAALAVLVIVLIVRTRRP